MELTYSVFDPNGNVTILVETPVEISRQSVAAAQLLRLEPAAEQVGFLLADTGGADIALRMAGGEFCGNASLCAAAFSAMQQPEIPKKHLEVAISGAEHPVSVSIQPDGANAWAGSVQMPLPLEISSLKLSLRTGVSELPFVRFPGICHIIDTCGDAASEAEQQIRSWCARLGCDALGVMHCDLTVGSMVPLVYVAGIDSLYHEHSCASGTSAAAAYLASVNGGSFSGSFSQPGGVLSAIACRDRILLGGKTVFRKQCHVSIDG